MELGAAELVKFRGRRWSFKGREEVGAWSAVRTRRGFGRGEESMKCSLRGDLMRVMGEACDRWRACENGQSDGTRLCRGPHGFVSI